VKFANFIEFSNEVTAMDTIHQVEVVVHVDESLSDDRRASLVNKLQGRDGVERARFSPGRNHLMVINYDTNKLQTSDVLSFVKEENIGAELIGI
jgi:cell division protein FtsX